MAGKIQTMIPQYGELNRIYRDYIDNYAFSFDRQKFISDFYQEYNDMKSFEAAILELVLDKQKEQYTLILNSLKTEIEKSIQAYEIRPLSDRAIERACYQHMERYSQEIEAQLDVTRSLSKPLNEANNRYDSIGYREHTAEEEKQAGKGTRMKSDKPKVVHQVMGKPMVYYSIEAARQAGADEVCVIVGYKADEVKSAIAASVNDVKVDYALQEEQLGTGHAVKCAADFIGRDGDVIILCGDTPLVTGDTLRKALDFHKESGNGVTVISAMLDDPFGYGRIIRNGDSLAKIVEQKDADEAEQAVKEVNSGMYIFDCAALQDALSQISNDNAQGEYYLPDAIEIIKKMGLPASAVPMDDADQIRGVNTLEQLADAEKIMENR